MKLTILLLIVGLMQVSATVYSQATKFKFKVDDKQVVEVLKEIEESSNFRFFYIREQVNVERRVSVKVNNATVEQILDEIFKDEGVNYRVMEDYLILLSPEDISAKDAKMMQQQNTISGKVTDEDGVSLPGVTVFVKGTTTGGVTDNNGIYKVTAKTGDVLTFSFVGMQTQEITIGDQTTIDVKMLIDSYGIEEVITIGYSTVKKRDVSGSISSINSEDLAKTGTTNIAQAIQGQTAGVLITKKSGRPGPDFQLESVE